MSQELLEDDQFDEGFAMDDQEQPGMDDQIVVNDGHSETQNEEAASPVFEVEAGTNAGIETDQISEPQIPPDTETPKKIQSVPQEISDEFEKLKKLNPQGAELAMEDSAEGAAIRSRLANYGAEQAQDRAEMVLERRERDIRAQRQREAREREERAFYHATLKKNVPEYYALCTDPEKRAEADRYNKNIMEWIDSQPYKIAAPLREIAARGNALQVCELVKAFEKDRNRSMADASAALAVPGRGAPYAPSGIGDKDDFDAGWNLNN